MDDERMTRADIDAIERETQWRYHVKSDGSDRKFVIQRQGTHGNEYRELVLKLRRCGPVLVYWVGGNRDQVQQEVSAVFEAGLPNGTSMLPAIPHGNNNVGHVFNLLIENVEVEEFRQHLDLVRGVVDMIQGLLRQYGFLH